MATLQIDPTPKANATLPLAENASTPKGNSSLPPGISTPTSLVHWLRTQPKNATNHTLRVFSSETSRWSKLPAQTLQEMTKNPPPSTGIQRWDAFIEAITAKRLHDRGLTAPEWTRKTSLEENWNPYAEANPHTAPIQDFWDMINTTPEFIEKAIIYPQQDLVNL